MSDKISENQASNSAKTAGRRDFDVRPGVSRRRFMGTGLGLIGATAYSTVAAAIVGRVAMQGYEGPPKPAEVVKKPEEPKKPAVTGDPEKIGTFVGKEGVNKVGSYFVAGATDAMGVDMAFHLETAKEIDPEEFYSKFPSEAVIASMDNKTFVKPKPKQTASNNP